MMRFVFIGLDLIPPHLAGYACDVICYHLRHMPPKQVDDREIKKEEKLAILSMVALFYFLDLFKISEVVDTLRLSWKGIYRWMLFFRIRYLKEQAENESGNLLEGMAGTLYFAMKMDRMLQKEICTDFAMKKFVAALWAKSYSADSRGYASLALTMFLNYSSSVADTVQDILFQLCYIPDVVSSKLIQERLINAKTLRSLNAFASLAVAFCTDATQTMMVTLWRDEAVYDVCDTLKRVLEQCPSPGDPGYELACSTYAQLITFVIRQLDCIIGEYILGDALKSNFLESLALVGPKFDMLRMQPIRRLITKFLSETLPRVILLREDSDFVVKAIETSMTPELRPKIMESSFAKEWALLELFVRERAVHEIFYRRDEDLGHIPKACGNVSWRKSLHEHVY